MTIRRTSLRKTAVYLAVLTFAILAWNLGYKTLGRAFPTVSPGWSESQAVEDAQRIINGIHSVGIVKYSHYPNGPIYVLIPFLKAGLASDWNTLRLIPLAISVICLALLSWRLFSLGKSLLDDITTAVFLACFILQPAFYIWQGTLHHESYSLSLVLLSSVAVSSRKGFSPWILMIIGFGAGWFGYDFLPGHVLVLLTLRIAVYFGYVNLSFRKILYLATRDSLFFISGCLYAIVAHLFQNILFFGSVKGGLLDLIGSASMRMGLEYNPRYNEAGNLSGTFNPLIISRDMAKSFLGGWQTLERTGVSYSGIYKWSNDLALILMGVFSFGNYFVNWAKYREIGVHYHRLKIAAFLIFSVGICLSCISWFFLMPNHAANHFVNLPRHFLLGLLLIGYLPLTLRCDTFSFFQSMMKPMNVSTRFFILFPIVPLAVSFFYYLLLVVILKIH